MRRRGLFFAAALLMTGALAWIVRPAHAYIEAAHSFGQVVGLSTNICLMQVTQVDREKCFIIYRKIKDIKGVHPTEVIKHNIGRGGLRPNEWKQAMDWAEPGKTAVFFHNGGASETCIGTWWYQAYAGGEWWNHSHGEPFLLRTYCGSPDKLVGLVASVLEGKEAIAPCMVDGDKELLHNRSAKIQRLKVSLKLQDYNQKRDFVGWGGEDFRRLQGMPGFTHISSVARTDPDARAISVVDFDNDGKPDLCLIGGGRLAVLQNNGESLGELTLPGVSSARSAVWADYNGDGLPDLFVVTPTGPKLFTNLGSGVLRDDTHVLPKEAFYQLTAAAWIDADGDGRPDLLLANGYHGLRLYRNIGLPIPGIPSQPKFGKWSFLGPVDYTQQKGFEFPHPCEKLDLKGEYIGKHNRKIAWKQANFTDGSVNDLLNQCPPDARVWCGVYLHRTVEVERDTELPLSFGSDDTLTVWLDGKKIVSDPSHRGCTPDQNRVTAKLSAGKHDLLLKICQGDGDFAFYFNYAKPERPVPQGPAFEDVSRQVGLGPDGASNDVKFDSLVVRDVDGDGRPDFLYGNRLFLNRGTGPKFSFVQSQVLDFVPQKAAPVFGDLGPSGRPDLLVPQKGSLKLYRNDGKGNFADATAKAGDLANFRGWATSAAWGDIDNDGHLDLVVGCLKGPNRFFRNKGDGTFEDATDKIGLGQRIFNTQAVTLVDLNGDGNLDFVFNNEGQDSTVLLGSGSLSAGKRMPLTLRVEGKQGLVGSTVRVVTKDGKLVASHELSGGDGRGGQQSPVVRFALEPGTYTVQLRLSSGAVRSRDFQVGESPVRGTLSDDGATR
jgi:hypothetical protein